MFRTQCSLDSQEQEELDSNSTMIKLTLNTLIPLSPEFIKGDSTTATKLMERVELSSENVGQIEISQHIIPRDTHKNWALRASIYLKQKRLKPEFRKSINMNFSLKNTKNPGKVEITQNGTLKAKIYLKQEKSINSKLDLRKEKFRKSINMNFSLRTTKETHKFCCNFCFENFVTYTDLELHMACHKIEADFNCDDCQQNFDSLE